ncbi:hypothetical protein AAG565_07650 [Fontimonas sp. SYSU GA230001]|uniref:YfaP family protein n=1 Tax=Fontimonas sp. SYSU GA230001 TaxID=3142450 RepID=UPI0032B47958
MNPTSSEGSGPQRRRHPARLVLLLCAGALALAACGGGGGGGGGDDGPQPTLPPSGTINPGDANAVMQSIAVKVGDFSGSLTSGNIPAQSANDPKVESVQANTPASNGSTAQVPVTINASAALSALFLKVPGANSLITVNLSGGGGKALSDQKAAFMANGNPKALDTFNVDVTLPPNIGEGFFDVDVAVQDSAGNVSNTGRGRITIARVGTGKLQFSLSWDAEVDLDLHVFEPDGNEIYYGNPGPSASGGELDIDDLNGPASSGRPAGEPEGVENVFYDSAAPTGIYTVRINYFSGQLAANFVVTVSADGQVLDTISGANFQAQNGCVRVYRLNYGGSAANSQGTISNPVLTPDPVGACGG